MVKDRQDWGFNAPDFLFHINLRIFKRQGIFSNDRWEIYIKFFASLPSCFNPYSVLSFHSSP
jgi:hypothetical protein